MARRKQRVKKNLNHVQRRCTAGRVVFRPEQDAPIVSGIRCLRTTSRRSAVSLHWLAVEPLNEPRSALFAYTPCSHSSLAFTTQFTDSETRDFPSLLDHINATNPRTKRASHCIYAFRSCLSTSPTPLTGASDGGESGAGEKLSRLLELGGYEDVIVIVFRWYGGVKLGNARWKCILGVAKEALSDGGFGRKGGSKG
ncbi:hypothetical protein BXZ70DRAFT_906288 [Cristinia sonorae]|uniref:Impact N-terminal domain-containing protein n=1 Tax=Cristinia sonorae TaxID=1940300 RepID=A0A8K0UR67_9AGAR|nr:hypothetical protein BXZ70DRAFT_906288 [Cristinia sonorae]